MRRRTFARVGYLSAVDPVSRGYRIEAFRQGLRVARIHRGNPHDTRIGTRGLSPSAALVGARSLSVSRSTLSLREACQRPKLLRTRRR